MTDQKIHSLDGLRGIAALFVVFAHIFTMFCSYLHIGLLSKQTPGKLAESIFNSPFTFFYKGNSAVMLFFVMSGFVLSYSIIRKGITQDFLRTAVVKRYIRLNLPVAVSILICFILMSVGIFTFKGSGITLPLSSAYSGDANLLDAVRQGLYGSIIFGQQQFNYVLWTIRIEFFGSLLVFFLLAFFGDSINKLRTICLIITFSTIFGGHAEIWPAGLFSSGVFLATFEVYNGKSKLRMWIAVLLLIVGLYLFGFNPDSKSYLYLQNKINYVSINWILIYSRDFMPIIGVLMITSCIVIYNNIFSIICTKPFQWLGKLSFSIYLLHTMAIAAIAPFVIKFVGAGVEGVILCIAAVFPLTIIFGYYFYKHVDLRSVELSRTLSSFFCKRKSKQHEAWVK